MSKIKKIKEESNTVKIYPTEEECTIQAHLVCPVEDCSKVFKRQSNLVMHVSQTHNKINFPRLSKSTPSSPDSSKKEFICPACVISKPWKSMKDLREHFLKVHVEKNVKCSKCDNGFSSETFMRRHFNFCGIKFTCQTCQCGYDSYESLKTHCRRKKHTCPEKKYFLFLKRQRKPKISVVPLDHLKKKMVLPQIETPYTVIIIPGVPEIIGNHQNIQTNILEKVELITRTTQVNIPIMKCEQSTQTNDISKTVSEGTQTLQDVKPIKRDLVELSTQTQKHIEMQTEKIEMFENSCNTSFILNDFEFSDTTIIKSSCSTQTHKNDDFYSTSTMTHDSIHTDTSDLLTDMSHFDTNFFNCNTETQTDFMLNENELFDNDFYSNMYTQTCDDILSGMSNFTDIETQTMVDDVLKSVESQTLMSKNGKIEGSFINMETQTDSEFREMLEIINS